MSRHGPAGCRQTTVWFHFGVGNADSHIKEAQLLGDGMHAPVGLDETGLCDPQKNSERRGPCRRVRASAIAKTGPKASRSSSGDTSPRRSIPTTSAALRLHRMSRKVVEGTSAAMARKKVLCVHHFVEASGGCVAWGGRMGVENRLNLDIAK